MKEMELYKLDSIEDGIAAMEAPDGMMLYFSANRLPEGSNSGDCFTLENGDFIFRKEETEDRRKAISGLLESLINKK